MSGRPLARAADNWLVPSPAKIILAWSSFAWDSNRGDLIHLWRWPRQLFRQRCLPLALEHAEMGAGGVAKRDFTDPFAGFRRSMVSRRRRFRRTPTTTTFSCPSRPLPDVGGAPITMATPIFASLETESANLSPHRALPLRPQPGRWQQGRRDHGLQRHACRPDPHRWRPDVGEPGHSAASRGAADTACPLKGCSVAVAEGGVDVLYVGATHRYATASMFGVTS